MIIWVALSRNYPGHAITALLDSSGFFDFSDGFGLIRTVPDKTGHYLTDKIKV